MIYTKTELLNAAKNAVPKADLLTLRINKQKRNFFIAHNSVFDQAGNSLDCGFMVEVLYKGHIAYSASQNLSPKAVAEAAKRAFLAAESGAGFKIADYDISIRANAKVNYETARTKKTLPSKPEIFDYLFAMCDGLKVSDEIIDTVAYTTLTENNMSLVTSEGGDVNQTFHIISSNFEATARRGDVIQRRSYNGSSARSFQGAADFINFESDLKAVRQVGDEAVELLSCETCPSDNRSLVLMPDQVMLQIHESVGHPLELDRILGDERNFAGSSFIKPKDIGSFQYGSKLMNITFDPTIPYELASYGADDTGTPAKKKFIIKEGILVNALGGIESSHRLYKDKAKFEEQVVANQRATSWNRAPVDRMPNLNLEPGTSSFDEIISSVEKGILMKSNRSWSIDDYRNKFQFGCEYGQLIENGKITKTVRDPNYRGISGTFWRSLSAVGDRSTFEVYGTPICGKGEPNQIIWTGHASPVCKFDNVEIFGGGK